MHSLAFIQNLNGPEIFIIFLIVLLLFGAKRLPELFKSFGKSIKEFKKATNEIEDDIRSAMDDTTPQAPATRPAPAASTVENSAPPQESPQSTPAAEENSNKTPTA